MLQKLKENKHYLILFLIALSAFFLLPITGPFQKLSVQFMVSDYFNFAKSMLQGNLLYVDLYDHKGIVLFLLYFIPVLISNTSYLGVFFVEGLVSIGVVLSCWRYCSYRYSKNTALIITSLTVLTLHVSFFQPMLNTEPISLIIVFLLLRYIEDKGYLDYSKRAYILFGFAFSVVFWMKYSLVLTIFPFWLFICIESVKNKKLVMFIKRCFISASVFGIITAFIFGYFAYHNALNTMLNTYFGTIEPEFCLIKGHVIEITLTMLFLLGLFGIVFNWKKYKHEKFFFILFLLVYLLTNCLASGPDAYTCSFMIFFLPMFLPDLLQIQKVKTLVLLLYLCSLVLTWTILYKVQTKQEYTDIEQIAKQYQITNEDILYLCEDAGFGVYFKEGFLYKYQWKPTRVSYDKNEECYEQTMTWLKNKDFPYVLVSKYDWEHEISEEMLESKHPLAMVILMAKENYQPIENISIYQGAIQNELYLCAPVTK